MKHKRVQYALVTLATLAVLLYGAPAVLLRLPSVRNGIRERLVAAWMARTGAPLVVGEVTIDWLNRLVAEDIRLQDESGRPLLDVGRVVADFRAAPLLRGKLALTGVRLFDFSLRLVRETPGGPTNMQFLIDTLSAGAGSSPDVDLRIQSLLLRRGTIRYDVRDAPPSPDRFDPSHIRIQNLSANIALNLLRSDSLDVRVRRLAFDEHSGFALRRLSLHIAGNDAGLSLRDCEIRLPGSALKIPHAHLLRDSLANAPVRLDIAPSELSLKDLAPFLPALANFGDPVTLAAEVSGYLNDINLRKLTLRYGEKMTLAGEITLRGAARPAETYIVGKVNELSLSPDGLAGLLNDFDAQPVLPAPVARLGTLRFSGEVSGFFDHLVAYGKLSSSIGSVETDLLVGSDRERNIPAYIRGRLSSSELLIGELFEADNPFGVARFEVEVDARRLGNSFAGNILARISEFDFRNYRYEDLQLAGRFHPGGFEGDLSIDDPNGRLRASGMFHSNDPMPVFQIIADLQNLRPDNLNLYDKLDSPDISLSLRAGLTGTLDDLQGDIRIDSLTIRTAPRNFFMKQFKATASGHASDKKLYISSDLVNGEINGDYSLATLLPGLMNIFRRYLPALIYTAGNDDHLAKENTFSLLLDVGDTEELSQTLKLPLALTSQGRIAGSYDNRAGKFRAEAFLPGLRIGNMKLESCYFTCENPLDRIDLRMRATQLNSKNVRNYIDLQAHAVNDSIESLLQWANNEERHSETRISASASFSGEPGGRSTGLRTDIRIDESPLLLNDSLWTISEANLVVRDRKIDVYNFMIARGDQYLFLDGSLSDRHDDVLTLDLNRIELSYIFDIAHLPMLRFGGKATGLFHISDPKKNVRIDGDLYVQDFSFNRVTLGDLSLSSRWDEVQKGIWMAGDIYENDTTRTDVSGYIYPVGKSEGLDLAFNAKRLNVSFLTPYLDNVLSGFKGRGEGYARLFGPFDGIDLEGRMFIREGDLGINFLHTYYTFADSVWLDPGSIRIQNLALYDPYGNTGAVNAQVRHERFRNFEFSADIQANNMQVYNASEKQQPTIYGTVFSSGTSRIRGNEQAIDFDVNMRTEPKTALSFNFMGNSTAVDYGFVAFQDRNAPEDTTQSVAPPPAPAKEEGTELRMNFTVDVTPDAHLELVMDPMAGDQIKGYGSGSLQIEYGSKTDLRMYGMFNILSGNYDFSLQQLIRKEFKIREGSVVSFRGDPNDANLSINAIYNVTANIGDLDPDLLGESARTNIPVNCVLQLEGALPNPSVSFDLELPGSNSELERKVKSYANTEDMMTRQIVYLLVLNKFHPSDFTQVARTNEFSAMTSAAISSQISSILSAITDKVQIGTNIRASQEGFNETEVEMLLSGQLWDNRLLFNGNFGYKNNPNVKNVFVGEFDIEYLLTPSGEFRLKAYNHANDMYRYLKQSLTTQGFGIMYKKDFSTLSELFRRRRRSPLTTP
jgi:hypothetical protein